MLVTLGPFISALEHHLLQLPWLVKGMDINGRDRKMKTLLDYDHFVETDFSRFDSTISALIMEEVEHKVFSLFFNKDDYPDFHNALKCTLKTRGQTADSYQYTTFGSRCSGDVHTSIGNGIINRFLIWLVYHKIPHNDWTAFHEGDDGIQAVSSQWVPQILYNFTMLRSLGFECKINHSEVLSELTFCGRVMYKKDGLLVSMADLPRALAKFHIVINTLPIKFAAVAKALSYISTDSHTPVLGSYAKALVRTLPEVSFEVLRKKLAKVQMRVYSKKKVLKGMISDFKSPGPEEYAVCSHRWQWTNSHLQYLDDYYSNLNYIPAVLPILLVEGIDVDSDKYTYYHDGTPNFC